MPPNPAPESQKNLAAIVAVWLLVGVAVAQGVMVALAPRSMTLEELIPPVPPHLSGKAVPGDAGKAVKDAQEVPLKDVADIPETEDPFRPEALPPGSGLPAEVITPPPSDLLAQEAIKLQSGEKPADSAEASAVVQAGPGVPFVSAPVPMSPSGTPDLKAMLDPSRAASVVSAANARPAGQGRGLPVVKPSAPEPDELFLRDRAPLDTPISDESVLTELEAGMALRAQGDLLGAVSHLRTALRTQPDHPKLIYQLAVTLDMMSQPQKAQPLWESLATLGKGAGRYHTLARERLVDGVKVSAEEAEEQEGRLSVVAAKVEPVDDPGNGERVKVRLTIRRNQEEPVTPEEVGDGTLAFGIHFFDVVNRKRIDRSTCIAPEQTLKCLSGDADWAEGTEEFEFEYHQPIMSADELKRFGLRKYYGYAFEIMYRGKLQDVMAEPVQMAKFAREIPLDRLMAPDAAGTAPDGSLFPGTGPAPAAEPAPQMAPPGTGDVDLPLPELGPSAR